VIQAARSAWTRDSPPDNDRIFQSTTGGFFIYAAANYAGDVTPDTFADEKENG